MALTAGFFCALEAFRKSLCLPISFMSYTKLYVLVIIETVKKKKRAN